MTDTAVLLQAATLTIDLGAIVDMAPALYRAGCRQFFVALVDEGVRLSVWSVEARV